MNIHIAQHEQRRNTYGASELRHAFENCDFPTVGKLILNHPFFKRLAHPAAAVHLANLCFEGFGVYSATQIANLIDTLEALEADASA